MNHLNLRKGKIMDYNKHFLLALGGVILALALTLLISIPLAAAQKITLETVIAVIALIVLLVIGVVVSWGIYWATNQITAKIAETEEYIQEANAQAINKLEVNMQEISGQAINKLEASIQGINGQVIAQLIPSPDIEILLGERGIAPPQGDGTTPAPDISFRVKGQKKSHPGDSAKYAPYLAAIVSLRSKQPQAGRFPQAVLQVSAVPLPSQCKFRYQSDTKPDNAQRAISGERVPNGGVYRLTVPFTNDLVIYQTPMLAGELMLHWDAETPEAELPEHFTLNYDVYTLNGVSSRAINIFIDWE